MGWPHLVEAKIVKVSDGESRYEMRIDAGRGGSSDGAGQSLQRYDMCDDEIKEFGRVARTIAGTYKLKFLPQNRKLCGPLFYRA